MMDLIIPKELVQFEDKIKETVIPCVDIEVRKAKTDVHDSKVGGEPYFPIEGLEYPMDSKGQAMRLLAQINFCEVPQMDGFPESGILQFFIRQDDDLHGIDFDDQTNTKDFRVVYHENIEEDRDKLIKDFSFLKIEEEVYFPLEHEGRMSFSLKKQWILETDYRFFEVFSEEERETMEKSMDGLEKDMYDVFSEVGHRIGGYPFFTQSDPREYGKGNRRFDTLLFQLDTEEKIDLMWGDCGVANFFINSEDLRKKDFSKVLYNWDCC